MADEYEDFDARSRRHRECDYRSDEVAEFWRDFSSRLRDALNPHAEQLWRGEYLLNTRAFRLQAEQSRWICRAIERHVAPAVDENGLGIAPLLWLRRYVSGEESRDENQVRAVQDLVAVAALRITGTLGDDYPLPKLPKSEGVVAGRGEQSRPVGGNDLQGAGDDDPPLGVDRTLYSRPMTKKEAAPLLGCQRGSANPQQWINRQVCAGKLQEPLASAGGFQFLLTDFPEHERKKVQWNNKAEA
jgi:hypothetical protein